MLHFTVLFTFNSLSMYAELLKILPLALVLFTALLPQVWYALHIGNF